MHRKSWHRTNKTCRCRYLNVIRKKCGPCIQFTRCSLEIGSGTLWSCTVPGRYRKNQSIKTFVLTLPEILKKKITINNLQLKKKKKTREISPTVSQHDRSVFFSPDEISFRLIPRLPIVVSCRKRYPQQNAQRETRPYRGVYVFGSNATPKKQKRVSRISVYPWSAGRTRFVRA